MDRLFGRVDSAYVIKLLLIAAVYVIAAKIGLSLAFATEQVTTVWPPTGIALVAILLLGYRYWPGIFVGAFVANILTNEPWLVAGGIAIGNTLEALAGAWLLQRVAGVDAKNLLQTNRNILAFVGLAGLASTVVSATIGTFSLAAGGIIPWQGYASVWPIWWVGDMMGNLIFAPVFLALANPSYIKRMRRRFLEAVILLAAAYAVSVYIFSYVSASALPITPFPYMIFPLLMWAALRFTQPGVVATTLVVALTAIWGTVNNLGPFAGGASVERNLIFLHIFLFVAGVTSLMMAAVVSERMRAAESLRLQALELGKVQDKMHKDLEERKQLEQQLKEANRRVTDILAGVLDEDTPRRFTRNNNNKDDGA